MPPEGESREGGGEEGSLRDPGRRARRRSGHDPEGLPEAGPTDPPDLNPGDKAAETRFKDISKAWEALEDTKKRLNYGDFGEVSREKSFDAEKARMAREAFGVRFGFGVRPGAGGFTEEFHFGGIDDLLGGLFGHAAEGKGIRLRGADLKAELELEFLEAIRGGEKRLTLPRPTLEGGVASETLGVVCFLATVSEDLHGLEVQAL